MRGRGCHPGWQAGGDAAAVGLLGKCACPVPSVTACGGRPSDDALVRPICQQTIFDALREITVMRSSAPTRQSWAN